MRYKVIYYGQELPDHYKIEVRNGFTSCVTGKGKTEYCALIDAQYHFKCFTDIDAKPDKGPGNQLASDDYLYYVEIHYAK